VTVDVVAIAAGVSRKTVFNYFSSKEDMLFDRDGEIQETTLASIRDRPPGVSVLEVFRELSRGDWRRIAKAGEAGGLPHDFWGIVQSDPGLEDHAEALFARHARTVGEALAAERGVASDDPAATRWRGRSEAPRWRC
jgi:AcrR family transcriptional regulator